MYGFAWISLKKVVSVATVVVAAVTVAHIVNASIAIAHYNKNKRNDKTGFVNKQGKIAMDFGYTTVAHMGCGAVATHNAILHAGDTSSLASVVYFMESHDLTACYFGAYYTNIQLYLKRKGYAPTLYKSGLKGNIDKKIKSSKRKIAILAYLYSKNYGHYVTIKYDKNFKVNNYGKEDRVYSYKSIDNLISTNKYNPRYLITI